MDQPQPDQLAHLLAPMSVDEFLNEYADRRALLISGRPDKFAHLNFGIEAFFDAAGKFGAASGRLKAAPATDGEEEIYVGAEPATLRHQFETGMTVCCAGISDQHAGLAAFAESIRYALTVPDMRFNSYLSPPGRGFNLHYDAQPIFTIQIEGAKRWWYGAAPIRPAPQCYSSAWDRKPDLATLQQVVLQPGDVLYLPAFTWHRARAESVSLGATLGTKGHHNQPLRRALERSALFADWPLGEVQPMLDASAGGKLPAAAKAYLTQQLEALRGVTEALTVDDLWQHWVEAVHEPKGPVVERVAGEVRRTDRLVREQGFGVHLMPGTRSDGSPGLKVLYAGAQATFDLAARSLLEWLLARDGSFDLREAAAQADGLTRTETRKILAELVTLGALVRAGD